MSTNESKKTKQTLKQHKQDFKNILSDAESQVDEFRKKLYEEIVRLDEEDRREMERYNNRKKMLAYKSQVAAQYSEDSNDSEYVPVDGQLKSGSMVYMKSCIGCHSLEPIDPKPSHGPSLGLIFNRRVGSNPSFMSYSKEMLSANFFWTRRNLYDFMANTRSLLPRTNCKLSTNPITSEADRADLISLFRQFTEETKFNVRWKEIQLRGYDSFQSSLHSTKQQILRGQLREKMNQNKDKAI